MSVLYKANHAQFHRIIQSNNRQRITFSVSTLNNYLLIQQENIARYFNYLLLTTIKDLVKLRRLTTLRVKAFDGRSRWNSFVSFRLCKVCRFAVVFVTTFFFCATTLRQQGFRPDPEISLLRNLNCRTILLPQIQN